MSWDLPPKLWLPSKPAIIRPAKELLRPAKQASFVPGMFPAGAVAAKGLSLKGSIVFNGSDELLSLSSFSSSTPNQKTYTCSLWQKTDTVATGLYFLLHWRTDASNFSGVLYNDGSDDSINTDSRISSTQLLEYDPGAVVVSTWANFIVAVDTTQATAANRCRIYKDGSELTTVESTTPAQNTDLFIFTNSSNIGIGANSVGSGFFDGRLADIIVVEGQQLTPSDFGYDNGGTWSWKDYTGTYGTHGLRINPQNSSEIGTDKSGNGYNFTLNNMDASNFDSGDLPPV